jgi:hypothetical protein
MTCRCSASIYQGCTSGLRSGNIQLVLPLADLADRMRHGVTQMLFDAERELLMLIIGDEIKWLSQEHGMTRWARRLVP